MKKIMIAMCLAGALCAFSADEDAAPKAEGQAPARREMRGQQRPQRQMTEEQRKQFEERREKFMADMKARREASQKKMIDVLKEAGLDEAKAKEALEKIQKIQQEGRPQFPGMGQGGMGPGMGGRQGMGPGMGGRQGRQGMGGRQGRRGAQRPVPQGE